MTDNIYLTPDALRSFRADPRTTENQKSALDRAIEHFDDGVVYDDLSGTPAFDEWLSARDERIQKNARPGEHGLIDAEARTVTTRDSDGNIVVSPLDSSTAATIADFDARKADARQNVLASLSDLTARARDLQAELDEIERQITPALQQARNELGVSLKDLQSSTGYTHNQIYSRLQSTQDEASQRARAGERKNPSVYVTKGVGVGVREAARILGLSESGVRKRVESGTLAHTRTETGRLRILLDD